MRESNRFRSEMRGGSVEVEGGDVRICFWAEPTRIVSDCFGRRSAYLFYPWMYNIYTYNGMKAAAGTKVVHEGQELPPFSNWKEVNSDWGNIMAYEKAKSVTDEWGCYDLVDDEDGIRELLLKLAVLMKRLADSMLMKFLDAYRVKMVAEKRRKLLDFKKQAHVSILKEKYFFARNLILSKMQSYEGFVDAED